MAMDPEDLVPESEHLKIKTLIANRLHYGKEYWRPLNMRQDYWALTYFLQDLAQSLKPNGIRRYVSNQPRTALDLAHSILTRNDAFWRIPLFQTGDENMDMRRLIGKVERSLQGMVYDLDDMFVRRGQPRFWKQMAHQALLRGHIAGKVHVTKEAMEYRDSPLVGEIYDSRLAFPSHDAYGLNYILIERATTMGDLVLMYPDAFPEKGEDDPNFDPNQRAFKVEYWSNNRPNRKGISGTLAVPVPIDHNMSLDLFTTLETAPTSATWLIPPYYHGYKPHELPVFSVFVNGLSVVSKPLLGSIIESQVRERSEMDGFAALGGWWQGDHAYTAEMGRGLLSAVEEQIPQWNEVVANILHYFGLHTYGQWISTTPDGQFPEFESGMEARIALTPDEKIERIKVEPISPDAFRLYQMIGQEIQNGTLSDVLRLGNPSANSAVLNQQINSAALNTLEPFQDGIETAGTIVGGSLLGQMAAAGSVIGKFELAASGRTGARRRNSTGLVSLEFDPTEDLGAFNGRRLRPVPVFKPALPDDLPTRLQAARYALDPRRPILSLTTVLEEVLQVEDPTDEIDRIWEDMATQDPVMVFELMAQALERHGETEIAARMRENEFRTKMLQEMQFRQQTGQGMPPLGGGGAPPAMPPGAGGGEFNAQQNGEAAYRPSAAEGANILGGLGEQMGV